MEAPTKEKKPEIRFSTGCDLIDIVIGGEPNVFGIAAGDITNLVGDTGTAKSLLSGEIIANAYYKFGKKLKWRYDNSENGFDFDTQYLYGIDILQEDDDFECSETVQDLFCNYKIFLKGLKKNELGIYISDSLDALSSDEEIKRGNKRVADFKKRKEGMEEKEKKKGSYQMEAPKFLSRSFFRELKSLTIEKNAILILVSQVRMNIDPFSKRKYTRSGGKALDHWCDNIIWLKNAVKLKKKNRVIGIYGMAETTKNRTPRPFRSCYFSLYFDYGVDNIGSNIDYLFNLRGDSGKVLKSAKIKWDDTITDISRIDLIDKIEDSKKMQKELKKRVVDKWEKIEESIRTNRKRKYQ